MTVSLKLASSETDVTPIYVARCKFARWHGARVPMRRRLGTYGILNLTALDAGAAGDAGGMSFPPVIAFAPASWLQINVVSYVDGRDTRLCGPIDFMSRLETLLSQILLDRLRIQLDLSWYRSHNSMFRIEMFLYEVHPVFTYYSRYAIA